MVKWTVIAADPGLKVICPVYCPGSSTLISTPTFAFPPGSMEPFVGFILSHGTSEEADQEVPLQLLPLLSSASWLKEPYP